MKAIDMTQLYEKLTVEEQAHLAFKAISESDEDTLNKITMAVPRDTYTMPDFKYWETIDTFAHIGFLWIAQYWKLFAMTGVPLLVFRRNNGEYHPDDAQHVNEAAQALNILKAHCLLFDGLEQHGINKKAMLKFCEDFDPVGITDVELKDLPDYAREYYDETLAFYVSLLKK